MNNEDVLSRIVSQLVGWCRMHNSQISPIDIGGNTRFYEINEEWRNHFVLWAEIASFISDEVLFDKFYPDEIPLNATIEQLANSLAAKLIYTTGNPDAECTSDNYGKTISNGKIEDPTVFILGCPRSGTTLFRTLLAGHPEVNAPPELHLLGYGNSLIVRERRIVDKGQTWRLGGVMQTLAHQLDMTEDQAFSYLSMLTRKDVSIKRIYELIHSTSQKSILVDKTPDYAKRVETMECAEEMFRNPRYLFIHRHPMAVMESWSRMRDGIAWGDNFQSLDLKSRLKIGEDKWLNINQNIFNFLDNIPDDRMFRVAYENLVKDTKSTLMSVAEFLNIPFNNAMLSPYSGERLLHGLGDPNITSRKFVDPTLIDSWRLHLKDVSLDSACVKMAKKLGYDV